MQFSLNYFKLFLGKNLTKYDTSKDGIV
jgi:hypothetical protein